MQNRQLNALAIESMSHLSLSEILEFAVALGDEAGQLRSWRFAIFLSRRISPDPSGAIGFFKTRTFCRTRGR